MTRKQSRRCVVALAIAALVVYVTDQVTKVWATQQLAGGKQIALLGDFLGLELHFNPGAAFSIATGATWVFAVVAIGVSVAVIRMIPRLDSLPWALTLGAFLGGTLGNLTDRLVRQPGFLVGHVVDFIRYGNWFVGNVADIALVLGAVALVCLSMLGVEPTHAGRSPVGVSADSEAAASTDGATSVMKAADGEAEPTADDGEGRKMAAITTQTGKADA